MIRNDKCYEVIYEINVLEINNYCKKKGLSVLQSVWVKEVYIIVRRMNGAGWKATGELGNPMDSNPVYAGCFSSSEGARNFK